MLYLNRTELIFFKDTQGSLLFRRYMNLFQQITRKYPFRVACVMSVLVLCAGWIAFSQLSGTKVPYENIVHTQQAPPAPSLELIRVQKPLLVVYGVGLDAVEIWAIPAGLGITEEMHQKLGVARVVAHERGNLAIWGFDIPAEPLSVVEIYARGFAGGNQVGTVRLPLSGVLEIQAALWNIPDQPVFPEF